MLGRQTLRFIGSMRLAIILFLIIAISSIIGTILKQNEPYQNYLLKFGPFWHDIYQTLALYDVYSSSWFVCLLAFLVTTTTICLINNTPLILKSIRRYQEDLPSERIRHLKQHQEWCTTKNPNETYQLIEQHLKQQGYRIKADKQRPTTCAAMRGQSNRLAYVATHAAIVIIIIGAMLDSNLWLKLKLFNGQIKIVTQSLAISQIPKTSILTPSNYGFKANVSLAEGETTRFAFINIKDGYLLKQLPFAIQLKDFRIEQYSSGQPKSFTSDLIIYDKEETLQQTISVNKPLYYQGHHIYQASFGDGGSKLKLKAHTLFTKDMTETSLEGTIGDTLNIAGQQLELIDFKRHNVVAEDNNEQLAASLLVAQDFKDHGPNYSYQLRDIDGNTREYLNYAYPVSFENSEFLLSGVRTTPQQPYHFLYIPVDADGSITRFLRFHAYLYDDQKITTIADQIAKTQSDLAIAKDLELNQVLVKFTRNFRQQGFDVINNYVKDQIPTADQPSVLTAFSKILQAMLIQIYLDVLTAEGVDLSNGMQAEDLTFFEDAINALSSLPKYQSPILLTLSDFEERQASGLLISQSPGKKFVYLGFFLLIIGVFLLFYIPHQRLWIHVYSHHQQTKILVGGQQTRQHNNIYDDYFKSLLQHLKTLS